MFSAWSFEVLSFEALNTKDFNLRFFYLNEIHGVFIETNRTKLICTNYRISPESKGQQLLSTSSIYPYPSDTSSDICRTVSCNYSGAIYPLWITLGHSQSDPLEWQFYSMISLSYSSIFCCLVLLSFFLLHFKHMLLNQCLMLECFNKGHKF